MLAQKTPIVEQVEYLGRWVDRKHFRAFVYNQSEQKLANSYDEYQELVASGLWFSTKEDALKVEVCSSEVKVELKPSESDDLKGEVVEIKSKSEKKRIRAQLNAAANSGSA